MSNTFIGSVGSVDLKHTPQGKPVLEVSFAENHSKQVNGQWEKDGTTWRRATLWEEKALSAANVIQKGDFIVVIGRERLREYEAKDGSTGKSLEVQAQWIAKIPPKLDSNNSGGFGGTNNSGFNTAPASNGGQGDPWGGSGSAGSWETPGNDEPPF